MPQDDTAVCTVYKGRMCVAEQQHHRILLLLPPPPPTSIPSPAARRRRINLLRAPSRRIYTLQLCGISTCRRPTPQLRRASTQSLPNRHPRPRSRLHPRHTRRPSPPTHPHINHLLHLRLRRRSPTPLLPRSRAAAEAAHPRRSAYHPLRPHHPQTRPQRPRQPVNKAHVDQTRKAAQDRVRLHVTDPDEAERIISQGVRYRIVNVWRPLNGRVESAPLAFAAALSVDNEHDLVAVEHRYPHRTGETMAVKYNPNQRWMYLSGMENDERLLLKCSDSLAAAQAEAGQGDGIAERVPHSAFWDPRTREGAKPRESIEVRALVIG
ncbi:putative methyltransferase [Aspergillus novofumigatus IBT 16806]|uniref:Uncharacterized protein n=1 Tax=Aspergillus novofumigatus (strain IBT 16806) TaxID=1392255 RepID=A0A2I1BT98_ASPN1|nr:uncharacterized protein P174DRAFT_473196 [Aspergillus novofumigatus IBT 16806]PKX88564.1 hypothetical protein P174DRAFT_473196 [Aspergillus novofumigatus IBT 16806]